MPLVSHLTKYKRLSSNPGLLLGFQTIALVSVHMFHPVENVNDEISLERS